MGWLCGGSAPRGASILPQFPARLLNPIPEGESRAAGFWEERKLTWPLGGLEQDLDVRDGEDALLVADPSFEPVVVHATNEVD